MHFLKSKAEKNVCFADVYDVTFTTDAHRRKGSTFSPYICLSSSLFQVSHALFFKYLQFLILIV